MASDVVVPGGAVTPGIVHAATPADPYLRELRELRGEKLLPHTTR
jgi:hypothetical protein